MPRRDAELEHVYAVILAGGSGTRFWPLSRRRRPKQLLEIFGPGPLLEQTFGRLRPLVRPAHTYVFTSALLRNAVARCLTAVPREQIVAEPAPRNTAPCLGLAAHELLRRDPEAVMIAVPSDHLIARPGAFRRALRVACRLASTEGCSALIGLKPSNPHTGYGYLQVEPQGCQVSGQKVFRVLRFTEKPSAAAARDYVRSGSYLWNSGIFVWRASTLLRNLDRFQPAMARGLERIACADGIRAKRALARLYPKLANISVDYALMEKISGIYAVGAEFGWSDVGSWSVAYDLAAKDRDGNARPKRSLCLGASGNLIVCGDGKFVAAVGVRDLVIVDAEDALLVCPRERAQEVGKAVAAIARHGFKELL